MFKKQQASQKLEWKSLIKINTTLIENKILHMTIFAIHNYWFHYDYYIMDKIGGILCRNTTHAITDNIWRQILNEWVANKEEKIKAENHSQKYKTISFGSEDVSVQKWKLYSKKKMLFKVCTMNKIILTIFLC